MKTTTPGKIAYAVIALIMLAAGAAQASELTLARIFSDGAVLQRGVPVPIWGTAEAGAEVTVSFGDQEKTTTAGPDGRWLLRLDPLEASSESRVLKITSNLQSSILNLQCSDVLVGEVWLCSGQSNMGAMMYLFANDPTKDPQYPEFKRGRFRGMFADLQKKEVEDNEDLLLRQFTVDVTKVPFEPSRTIPSKRGWYKVTPGQTEFFTQVGYYFARELRRELDVPVGIINSSKGGSKVEVWTPKEAFNEVPGGCDYYADQEKSIRKRAESWARKKAAGELSEQEREQGDPAKHGYIASSLYHGMIAPLMPYAIKGAIWYQGESNVKNRNETYSDTLVAMIKHWRKNWGQDKLYFFWTQIAHHKEPTEVPLEEDAKASLYYQQFQAMARVPDGGMSVANDIGHHLTIHPPNKLDIGRRLSRWALNKSYGIDIVPSGPVFQSARKEGAKVTLTFDYSGSGLMVAGKSIGDDPAVEVDEPLGHFQICGADREWKWAEARISGRDTVEVWHPDVADPVEVRYAWAANPAAANLYNKEGLPTSLFKAELK